MSGNNMNIILEISASEGNFKLKTSLSQSAIGETSGSCSMHVEVINDKQKQKTEVEAQSLNDIEQQQQALNELSLQHKKKREELTAAVAAAVAAQELEHKQQAQQQMILLNQIAAAVEKRQYILPSGEPSEMTVVNESHSQDHENNDWYECENGESDDEGQQSLNESLMRNQQTLAQALAQVVPISHNSQMAIQQQLIDQQHNFPAIWEKVKAEDAKTWTQTMARAEARAHARSARARDAANLGHVERELRNLFVSSKPGNLFVDQCKLNLHTTRNITNTCDEEEEMDEAEHQDQLNQSIIRSQQTLAQTLAQALPISNNALLAVQQQLVAQQKKMLEVQAHTRAIADEWASTLERAEDYVKQQQELNKTLGENDGDDDDVFFSQVHTESRE